jgi:hypothetical protein
MYLERVLGTPAYMPDTTTSSPPAAGPLLSNDVPQEVTYSGDSYILLQVEPNWFIASADDAEGGAS